MSVKKNSVDRPLTLDDLGIEDKEPTREEINSIYQKQREVYPKLNEIVKQYIENNYK